MRFSQIYETSPIEYPVSDDSNYHYRPFYGSVLMWMTPQHFISLAPSGGPVSEWENDPYVDALAQHIIDQFPLDALELGGDIQGGHDGRHRAWAAVKAGVTRVPVYVEPDMAPHFDEANGWNDDLIQAVENGNHDS